MSKQIIMGVDVNRPLTVDDFEELSVEDLNQFHDLLVEIHSEYKWKGSPNNKDEVDRTRHRALMKITGLNISTVCEAIRQRKKKPPEVAVISRGRAAERTYLANPNLMPSRPPTLDPEDEPPVEEPANSMAENFTVTRDDMLRVRYGNGDVVEFDCILAKCLGCGEVSDREEDCHCGSGPWAIFHFKQVEFRGEGDDDLTQIKPAVESRPFRVIGKS